ncbi:MAG: methyltransferase domain-containing protein [Sinomicrobium sp.]|nr:methyltransferase domain-containing protein [Sinomicrobium sp.]
MESSTLSITGAAGMYQKSFDHILEDYAFFERHATEMENGLRAARAHVANIRTSERPFRLLDFGAGAGSFTRAFLWETDLHRRMKLDLTLVEPGAMAREQAFDRLRTFTGRPISILEELPDGMTTRFDLIISNHAIYYVPDLNQTINRLLHHCSAVGKALISAAGSENFLVRLWDYGFDLIDGTPPFYRAEDLEVVLEKNGLNYSCERVFYELNFPDSTENRMKILRFLFGDYLSAFPIYRLLDFFDTYLVKGEIRIKTSYYLYVF